MRKVLVDSNIILDIFTEDPKWFEWSAEQLELLAEQHMLIINPVIYGEVSVRFKCIEELEESLPHSQFRRLPLPWEAAFLAAKVFMQYKKNGGKKDSTMPDFFIGAHAAVENMVLLTRDTDRYKTYFPRLELIAPPYNITPTSTVFSAHLSS